MEYYDYVQRGFRLLLPSFSGFIGKEMSKKYGNRWWNEVLYVLYDQYDLPKEGSYAECVDSLDIANCIRLLKREWDNVFYILPKNCRVWATELMGFRNIVSHIGNQDLDQAEAERALNTMVLLCREIDRDCADEIKDLYTEVRSKAADYPKTSVVIKNEYTGLDQPEAASSRGELSEGSLLKLIDSDLVRKTTLTRKVTFGGKTTVYPVYQIALNSVYYNDQNDRISTWISRYESENGEDSLSGLSHDIYNRIIENFIVESNPDAILKTQKNIQLVGQREPGVTLADGRVVDGNRRLTCLRRIQRATGIPQYFETVLIDVDINADRKQIKLLELAIQHGEEKKVDYDLIDFAIGTYRDIVLTKLLTEQEYADSAGESVADVRKRLTIAGMISDFLDYIRLPGQYFVAREYQLYSLFQEMLSPMNQLDASEKPLLTRIAYHNVIMKAIPDQRKFIRDIKALIRADAYAGYFESQLETGRKIEDGLRKIEIRSKEDIDTFALNNPEICEELKQSMEEALLRMRAAKLNAKPTENAEKCIGLLMDLDPRLFSNMTTEEKESFLSGLTDLERIITAFKSML